MEKGLPLTQHFIMNKAKSMEEIIKTAGIAISSVLALAVLFVIVRSQWTIWRQERRQEKQHIYNK